MLQGTERSGALARQLRSNASLPERLLWNLLKSKPDGLKFRRQHPSGPYVADFYCHEQRLVVEIDGAMHNMGDRPERDLERDRWFQERGLQVLRVPAADVLRDPVAIAESLVRFCRPVPPPSALRAATSPKGGGLPGMP